MTVTTPCRSQSCSKHVTFAFDISMFSGAMLSRLLVAEGWKKITTRDNKTAWLCPRCKWSE